jgi:hypothetical protein
MGLAGVVHASLDTAIARMHGMGAARAARLLHRGGIISLHAVSTRAAVDATANAAAASILVSEVGWVELLPCINLIALVSVLSWHKHSTTALVRLLRR